MNAAPISTQSGNICTTCAGVGENPGGTQTYSVLGDDKTILNNTAGSEFTSTLIGGIGAFTVDAAGKTYIADSTYNAVFVFAAGATGTVTPIVTIEGTNVPFNDISGIAVDSKGTIYVANYLGNAVYEYAAGSNGNIAPTNTLAGSATDLGSDYGLAINAQDALAVSTQSAGLLEFAAGAGGNVAPMKMTVNQLSGSDEGVCFDLSSGNVFVVKSDGSVVGFDPNFKLLTFLTGSATALNHPKNCVAGPVIL